MAQITLVVNDAFVARIVAAFTFYYPTLMQGVPAGAGAKAVIIQFTKDTVANFEAQAKANTPGTLEAQLNAVSTQYTQSFAAQLTQTQADVGANVT